MRMLDPVTLHMLHRYEVIDADSLHEMVENLEPGTARYRRHALLIVFASLVLLAVGVAALYYFSDASFRADLVGTLTNPAIMGPNIICCFVVPWLVARQARMKRVHSVMLKHRRCPHCGYDLRGTPADPSDGARVCSECGCAWMLDDPAIIAEADSVAQALQMRRRRGILMLVLVGLTVLAVLGAVVLVLRM